MEKQQLTIKTYVLAWNELDEDKLLQILTGCVAANVSYCDPFTQQTEGLKALNTNYDGSKPKLHRRHP